MTIMRRGLPRLAGMIHCMIKEKRTGLKRDWTEKNERSEGIERIVGTKK